MIGNFLEIPKTTIVDTYTADIYIAGPIDMIKHICQEYCGTYGLCVHVIPCEYVYTGGREAGAKIGLINYPRFPVEPCEVARRAEDLGKMLMLRLHQGSFTVVYPDQTIFYDRRKYA